MARRRARQDARSKTSLATALAAIARTAARVCDANDALIFTLDGDDLWLVAKYGRVPVTRQVVGAVPVSLELPGGYAVRHRRTVHVQDFRQSRWATHPLMKARLAASEVRTGLHVPLLRGDRALGVIVLRRTRVQPFTRPQIALLKTFADQAAIAIENAQLGEQLVAKNAQLAESLERERATAEILRVISQSPTDPQPVFEALADGARRLCDTDDVSVLLVTGGTLHRVVHLGQIDPLMPDERVPISSASLLGRTILEQRLHHVADMTTLDEREFPLSAELTRRFGIRTALLVPLIRDGSAVGVINLRRREVRPFTERQIALVETFAAQAVIAIENVRLFTELQASNRHLTTALDQQTATADILRVISSSPTDLPPVMDAVVRSAARLCGASEAQILRPDGDGLRLVAETGSSAMPPARPISRGYAAGRAFVERRTLHITDMLEVLSDYPETSSPAFGTRTLLATPLMREGVAIGVIRISRREVQPFTEQQIELLKTFADQAVIAIENVRLFTELEARNRDLTDSLDRQTATGEILRVISTSQDEIAPVFDVITRSAARLCAADLSGVLLVENGEIAVVGSHGFTARTLSFYPRPLDTSTHNGRAILERRVVHIPDLAAEPSVVTAQQPAFRSQLSVPMMRGDQPIGVVVVARHQPGWFSDAQVELLKTFADQAVIAIENARLLSELQTRNQDLTESLDRQTATAEILRVISGSPTEVQPVFDTIVRNAGRVCDAVDAVLLIREGDEQVTAAHWGPLGVRLGGRIPLTRGSVMGRAILDVRPVHVEDLMTSYHDFPFGRELAQQYGHRTTLGVPLHREGMALGSLLIRRTEVRPFSDAQIAMLQTFADQAVIAIENVRLFRELESRNHDLTELLDRQTATADVLRVISQSQTDIQPVFDAIVQSAERLCDASCGALWRVEGDALQLVAQQHWTPEGLALAGQAFPMPLTGDSLLVRTILGGEIIHVPDALDTPDRLVLQRALGYRTLLLVPIVRDGRAVGIVSVGRSEVRPFAESQIEILKTFADQAVIAIENARLLNELQARNRDLTRTLAQQTATADILRVISRSPTDEQPVFDSIVTSAKTLLDGHSAVVRLLEHGHLRAVAFTSTGPEADARLQRDVPLETLPYYAAVVRERVASYMSDVETDPRSSESANLNARRRGYRSMATAPMIRDGASIGLINVTRSMPGPFATDEIELLKIFADQAVIAIENVRLFHELGQRNRDLTESLDRQTASGEILRAISQSQTEPQPVFDAIVRNAVRLCGASHGGVYRFDGELIHAVAHEGFTPEQLADWRRLWPMLVTATTLTARAIRTRSTVNIADIEATDVTEIPDVALANLRTRGVRNVVTVPMFRRGDVIGAISLSHRETGAFSEAHVELLRTFADQAVIAIENARLLTELQSRNRDLMESLDRQTASAEILRVIGQSPTDVQPVFDAIARNAVRLCGAVTGSVFIVEGDTVSIPAAIGPADAVAYVRQTTPRSLSAASGLMMRVALGEGRIHHLEDQQTDPRSTPMMREVAQRFGFRSILAVPMIREGQVVGAIGVNRPEAGRFSDNHIQLLQTFADQAVIAIENVRLFKELEARNRDLMTALDQQTATGDILRVISRSQTDVTPVFQAIVDSAARLLRGNSAVLGRVIGEQVELAAFTRTDEAGDALLKSLFPIPLQSSGDAARPIRDLVIGAREPYNVADVQSDPRVGERGRASARARGYRSQLVVSMLRHDEVIGTIAVTRPEPGAFSDDEVALLRTFADQAVIAIENARLLGELQTRTDDLTRSVDQLTALGEVGQAVSSSLELETVLSTIVSRAIQLAGANAGTIWEYDELAEEFALRITENIDQAGALPRQDTRIRRGEGAVGRLAVTHEPVQIPDITVEGAYEGRLRDVLVGGGTRALLAVPLLREGRILGGLVMSRRTPGQFPPEVVDVLRTFATQSALAIQNARLFRELEGKGRELEVASRHKSEFVANMSHELRTPLNAIIGYSEMLEEEAEDLGQASFVADLKKINTAGKHLLELINAVLDLSKIEAGRMELYLEDFDVRGVVRDIATVIQPLAEKNHNRVEVVCAPDVGVIHADVTKVRQSLFNLLSNACKFTERGTVSLTVRRESDAAEWIVFDVWDTGIGMTTEQIGRLFEDFSQADVATTRRYGGTGLGLALSRRLCRMMGGDIAVASESGRGSTFTIRLPARVEAPAPAAPIVGQGPEGGRVVLVIDDEAAVRELLQRTLVKEGFRVTTAPGGEDGLRLARELVPDVITLDVMMPGLDGWAVLSALKADATTADIPVVMLTVADNRNLAFALGAAEYLTKPIDRERLAAVVKKYRRDRPVLIVDDDPAMREILRSFLTAEGFAVVEADNGRAALERLREAPAGVVLLDLMMPEMDGFELVEALRRTDALRGIPVIVVTAKDLTADDRARLNGHVERILEKRALSRDQLLRQVSELVTSALAGRRESP